MQVNAFFNWYQNQYNFLLRRDKDCTVLYCEIIYKQTNFLISFVAQWLKQVCSIDYEGEGADLAQHYDK